MAEIAKEGIGGSDAGAICGLNPYASPMSVYQDKTSPEITGQDNEAMRQGRDLENYVAQRFMEATGLKVRRSNVMYKSEEFPFMLADVDRMVVGEECRAGVQDGQRLSTGAVERWRNSAPLLNPVSSLYGGDGKEMLVSGGGYTGARVPVCEVGTG